MGSFKHSNFHRFDVILLMVIVSCLLVGMPILDIHSKQSRYAKSEDNGQLKTSPESEYWNPPLNITVGLSPSSVFVGDANNDGYKDIITSNMGQNSLSILIWNSSLNDWNPQIIKGVGGSKPIDIFIEDANNDGFLDILTLNQETHDVSVLIWDNEKEDWNSAITKEIEQDSQ